MSKRGRGQRTLSLLKAATAILEGMQPIPVRGVCYQLFVRALITSMAKKNTNRVSRMLTWAREEDRIPWEWIVDETREAERVSAWENPAAYVETVRWAYRRDRWADQPELVEIWSEKGTVRGTLAPVLNRYGVTFRVMHGYTSATEAHNAAAASGQSRKPLTACLLGDWDCSGMHISEVDLPRRLKRYGGAIRLERVALTSVDTMSLPSYPAKRSDPRYRWYVDLYGHECWELDALSPTILRDRVEKFILERLDLDAWHRADVVEQAEQESLRTILNAWPGISRRASE